LNQRIGFIGLGVMGLPMAKNLISAGYSLVVYDTRPGPVGELTQLGAVAAGSPREAAKASDVIITMLPDSADVESVALGEKGLIDAVHDGQIHIDMSTIAPSAAVKVAQALGQKGVRCLDAPVSGGDVGAQKGTLSIMVGGAEDLFNEVLPILRSMGKNIVWCGPNGAGQTVKACNQVLVAVTIAGVAEALVLGAKAGVDPATIVKVLSGGLARCGVLENRGERIVKGDFAPGFRSRLHYKDLNIIMRTSNDFGVPMPVTSAVHELFNAMLVKGRGELDHTGLITVLKDLAGIEARTKL
jgi:2-hydroxy-3-oxopropionate reductase